MKKQMILIGLAYIVIPLVAMSDTQKNTGLWLNTVMTGPLTTKQWKYYLEPQLRFIDENRKIYQENLYLGIYHETKPNLNLYLGMYGGNHYNDDKPATQELRFWERMEWKALSNKNFDLTSRTQLEQRKRSSEGQIANRLREKLSFKLKQKKYDIVVAEEVFFQLNEPSWVSDRFFSENRTSIGIEAPMSPCINYHIGYLNQYKFNDPDAMTNVIYLGLKG